MNLKLDQKKTISTVTQGAGAVGGVLASKVAMSFAPASFNKPISKVILGTIFLVGSTLAPSKGPGSDVLKGMGFGAGAIQLAEGFSGLIKPSVEKMQEGKVKQIAQTAIGGLAGVDTDVIELPPVNLQRRSSQSQKIGGFAAA